jgi:alpha-mannosidase
VIGGLLGPPVDDRTLWKAWELLLFNQTHDLASGVMTDRVYADVVSELDHARRLGLGLFDDGFSSLAAALDTRGAGVALVVFNPLGWERDDLAEATFGFTEPGVRSVAITDPSGRPVPAQIVSAVRGADGALREARVAFLARGVPAVGCAVFHAAGSTADDATQFGTSTQADASASLDHELYHVELDARTGALLRLDVKDGSWPAIRAPANVVSREVDEGDLWETYQPLDGGSRIGVMKKQAVPRPGATTRLSDEFQGEPGVVRNGPVFSEFEVAHDFDGGDFATTVRVARGVRRVEFRTRLVNRSRQVRYQALFPTAITAGRSVHAIPFGAIERPPDVEFPAQEWVDWSDGDRGVALLNVGLPGNLVADGTLIVSLLRAQTLRGYTEGGGSSDTGYELNVPRTLHYALVPHRGDWRDARVFRDGMELRAPLVCRKVSAHPGPLGARFGLLSISAPNVVLSSVQSGRDGAVLVRVYEAAGRATPDVVLTTATPILEAGETNLLEDPGPPLKAGGRSVSFALRPCEIKTLRLRMQPARRP